MNHTVFDAPVARSVLASHSAPEWRRNAALLGYTGLVPFVVLAAFALFPVGNLEQQAREALIAYGAVIISFLGAWHWYAAIHHGGAHATLARMSFAVSPALLGWIATVLPQSYGMALVIAGLLITCIADGRVQDIHPWYRLLRRRLTLIASASMTVAVFSQL